MAKLMRILGGYITHLSLCAQGANNIQTIYKSEGHDDLSITLTSCSKEMTEQGEIVTAVYVPEMVDLQGDVCSAEVCKQLAYSFSKGGKGIDIMHNEKVMPKDAVYVAESFMIQKGDPRFEGMTDYDDNPVDVTGGWGAVIQVDDVELRKLYRSGEWQGISMGGVTAKRPITLAKAVKINGIPNDEDIIMDAKEMAALLEQSLKTSNEGLVTALVPAITEGITKALKPKEPEKKPEDVALATAKATFMKSYPTPVPPANPSDDQLVLLEKAIMVHDLASTVDPTVGMEILEFHKARKAIMEGKEVTVTTQKSLASDPWGFQRTNQEAGTHKTHEAAATPGAAISYDVDSSEQLSDVEVTDILKMVPAYGVAKESKKATA